MPRKVFTQEFKETAVRLARRPGVSVEQAAIFIQSPLLFGKDAAQFFQHEEPTPLGHHHIENQQIGVFAFGHCQALIAVAGLYFTLFQRDGKRFRMISWMYVVSLAILWAAKGRAYYLAGAYPMIYATGSVWVERSLAGASKSMRAAAQSAICGRGIS